MAAPDLPDIHTCPTGRPILNENSLGTVPSRSSPSGSTATAATSNDNEVVVLGHGRHETGCSSELSDNAQQRRRGRGNERAEGRQMQIRLGRGSYPGNEHGNGPYFTVRETENMSA